MLGVILIVFIISFLLYKVFSFSDNNNTVVEKGKPKKYIPRTEWQGRNRGTKHYRTQAFESDRVQEVIERYREPKELPVVFEAPAKPVPEPPKFEIIVGKPPVKPETINKEETSITVYKPNRLIASVIEEAGKEYQLPSGSVDMPVQETGAIVAVILYLINAEPKIGITKLEYYIILLDKMCYQETGQRLFNYRLTYGPYGYFIQNFRAFLDFLEDKEIISKRRDYYARRKYRIDFKTRHEVSEEMFPEQMRNWIRQILFTWKGAGADHTKRGILGQFNALEIEAFTNALN